MQDVMDFVVSKGVVPEFMIHELGLGKEVKGFKGIEGFIKDLSSKINSNDPIERAEIRSIGKKHGVGDTIIAKAAISICKVTSFSSLFIFHQKLQPLNLS